MTENAQLDGKVAIVTGGSKGIGRSIAAGLLAAGARVAISGRSAAALKEAAAELRKGAGFGEGGPADRLLGVPGDVANEQDAAKLINQAVERFGGLDILINNAGIGRFANIAEMSTEDWNAIIGTNLTGAFFCTRAALPLLRQRGGGYIINLSSLASKNAFAGGGAYCASKAALNSFTEALMLETRQDNIRVSDVLPGSVQTEFNNNTITSASDWKLSPDDVARVVIDLLAHPSRSLPSRVELRPSKPPKKG
jgi:NAD(P)-dependent dehydrogenase (short-subunit alcohol dehydrogenase family)